MSCEDFKLEMLEEGYSLQIVVHQGYLAKRGAIDDEDLDKPLTASQCQWIYENL